MRSHILRRLLSQGTPILDLYPSTAGAYSLRQLSSSVTNVVRVRRSSDNAELDFTATQVIDGTLTSWVGANNGFVRTWYDQTGSGRHAIQATAALQPRIVNAGVLETDNGKPIIRFAAGNNQSLVAAMVNKPLHVFMVSRFRSLAGTGSNPCNLFDGNTVDTLDMREDGTNFEIYGGAFLYQGTQGNSLTTNLYDVFFNSVSSGSSYFLNGTSIVDSGNAGIGGNNSGIIIGNYLSGNRCPNANISEIILYGSNQSANRTPITSNIKTFYAIP